MRTVALGAVAAVLFACGQSPAQPSTVSPTAALIEQARQQLAPDRRTTVFDVRVVEAGIASGVTPGGPPTGSPGTTVTLTGEIHSAALEKELFAVLAKEPRYTFVDQIQALPHPDLGDRIHGVVSASVINIRTKPDHAAEMATQAVLGTPLHVLKQEKGWFYVQTPDRYLGWTNDVITRMTPPEFERWSKKPKVLVTTEVAFLRTGLDAAAPVVGDVVAGALLAVIAEAPGHYDVEYPDGRTAVLPRAMGQEYPEWLAAARDTPESIVATARRFVGVPYLWGGTSAKGMDCSGFTKTVFFLNGVLLPRDASQQVEVGELIDTSAGIDLRPGDLLYFGTRATGQRKERVTHVAISLGGARFIHASSDVHVNSLALADADYAPDRAATFLRARRVIGVSAAQGVLRLRDLPYYGVTHE
jgi:cell wall-associated NlpC family hydrolase